MAAEAPSRVLFSQISDTSLVARLTCSRAAASAQSGSANLDTEHCALHHRRPAAIGAGAHCAGSDSDSPGSSVGASCSDSGSGILVLISKWHLRALVGSRGASVAVNSTPHLFSWKPSRGALSRRQAPCFRRDQGSITNFALLGRTVGLLFVVSKETHLETDNAKTRLDPMGRNT